MTTYNTSSDAANTMIRAFLTKVGETVECIIPVKTEKTVQR